MKYSKKSKILKKLIIGLGFLLFLIFFLLVWYLYFDFKIIINILLIYYIFLMGYSYIFYKKVSYVLLFLCILFLFNYGHTIIVIKNGMLLKGSSFNEYIFSDNTQRYILLSLIINLLGINIGMLLYEIFNKDIKIECKKIKEKIPKCLENTILISSIFVLIINIKKIIQVKELGYLAIYQGRINEGIIEKIIVTIYPIFLIIYLSYLPKKSKKFIIIILGYIFVNLTTSLQGGRSAILGAIIFLIWFLTRYYSLKISFFKSFLAILLLVILFDFITIKRIFPNENYIEWVYKNGFSFLEKINYILYDQGQSVTLIGYYNDYKIQINELKKIPYVFQFLLEPVRIIYYKLNNLTSVNDIGFMKISNNLQQQLTYIVTPESFLLGQGVGGNYIVELLDLGGYFSLFFGNAILIYLILVAENKFENYDIIIRMILLYIFSALVFITRGNFINFSIFKIFQILVVYLVLKLFLKKLNINSNID